MEITTTFYKTINPPAFSIQNWLFALIVLGAVTAFVVGIAIEHYNIQMDSNAFIYMIFIGLIAGSLVDLVLNIISFVFPLMLIVAFGIYIWRVRS